jgi:hypothetical protein
MKKLLLLLLLIPKVEWFNVEAADARDLIQKLINNVKA